MRRRRMMPEEDPTGASVAVREFNGHHGPARVFYNRHAGTFFVNVYPIGADERFGDMVDGIDVVEVYRKTSAMPDACTRTISRSSSPRTSPPPRCSSWRTGSRPASSGA